MVLSVFQVANVVSELMSFLFPWLKSAWISQPGVRSSLAGMESALHFLKMDWIGSQYGLNLVTETLISFSALSALEIVTNNHLPNVF